MTCELMLRSHLDQFKSQHDLSTEVENAKLLLETFQPRYKSDRFGYEDFTYSGDIGQLSRETTSKIFRHLNGVVRDQYNTHFDIDMVSFAIRGRESIQHALREIEAHEVELWQLYEQNIRSLGEQTPAARDVVVEISRWGVPIYAILSAFYMLGGEHFTTGSVVNFLAPIAILGTSVALSRDHLAQRQDSQFISLKDILFSAANGAFNERDFFAVSRSIELPEDFNNLLMSEPNPQDYQRRWTGVLEWGDPSAMMRLLRRSSAIVQQVRQSRMPRSTNRTSVISHFIFQDVKTQEPVWIMVYRSFKHSPHGTGGLIDRIRPRKKL